MVSRAIIGIVKRALNWKASTGVTAASAVGARLLATSVPTAAHPSTVPTTTATPTSTMTPTPVPTESPAPTNPPTSSPTTTAVVRTYDQLEQAIVQAVGSSTKLIIDLLADIAMPARLDIKSAVTIRSQVGAVLSGGGSTELFYVHFSGTLVGENITLREARSRFGGGLYNAGTATLSDCTATANSASESGGGLSILELRR